MKGIKGAFVMGKKEYFAYFKVMISACLMVGASVGLCFYSAGAFYEPLASGLKISLGQASASTTYMLVFMALSALLVPSLLKKLHFLDLLLIGTALCAGSVLAIAFSLNIVWVYVFSSLMGIGAALIGMVPANTLIQNWFETRRSWTTSIVLGGSALSAALFSPLFSAGIDVFGWRMGFVVQAVLVLVMMLPALLWKITLTPDQSGTVAFGAGHEHEPEPDTRKMPNSVLWSFALIAVLSAILIALPMHFSTLATSLGARALLGASMLSAAMIGNLLFKLVGGWLSSKLKAVWTTGLLDLVALVATAGILISIFAKATGGLIVLAFFFGSAYGVTELSLPLMVSANVGKRHFSMLYAVLNCLSTLTTAISIMVIGYMYDGLHSYVWMYVLALAAEVLIAFLLWMMLNNRNADEFVTNDATRSLVLKIRDFEARRKEEHARKTYEKNEQNAMEPQTGKNSQPYESAKKAPNFYEQMALIDEDEPANHEHMAAASDTSYRSEASEDSQGQPVYDAEYYEDEEPDTGVLSE